MIFLIVSVIMVGVIYGYCGWRLLVPLELPSHLALASWLCLTVLALLPHLYLGYVRRSNAPERLKDWLAWAAYLGLGWVTITFSLLVVSDLVRIMWFGVEAALPQLYRFLVTDLIDPARVLSRANVGVIGLAALLTARGLYAARRNPRVVDVTVPIDGLPPSLQGFRIAQITDLHVGPTIKGDFVAAVVETVNDLHVDLIAFTGDLADGSVQRHRSDVAPLALLRAVHGCYFVTGNHEYYSGVEEWVDEARRLGSSRDYSLLRRARGQQGPFPSVAEAEAHDYSQADRSIVAHNGNRSFYGDPDQCRVWIESLAENYRVGEMVVLTICHDPDERRRSYELLAEAMSG